MTATGYIFLSLSCLFLASLWRLDLLEERAARGEYRATARQRRMWRAERRKAGFR